MARRSGSLILLWAREPASHWASRTSQRLSFRWVQNSYGAHSSDGSATVWPGVSGPQESRQPRAV